MSPTRMPVRARAAHAHLPALPPQGWVYEEKVDGWRMLAYKEGAEKLPW